jgi:hypothetical protein
MIALIINTIRINIEVGGGLHSVIRWGEPFNKIPAGLRPRHFVHKDFVEVGGGFEPP